MSRWLKIPLIIVSVIFGLMLLSMLIVPWQVKKQGSQWIADQTERTLSIEKAFFNPFTLTVELENLTLSEPNSDDTFVSFSRLMVSGSIRSLLAKAVILDRVELDDLFVDVFFLGKQEFNFSDFTRIGGETPKPQTDEPSEPLHFSLNNIVLTNAGVNFTDQTSELKSQHRIREFDLSIPFVGNIPYLTDEYVEPQMRMLLNGAEFQASGQLKPFHDSFETNLFLTLEGVDLAWYAYHSPVPLPIDVKQGDLDCEIDLAYRVSNTEEPKLMLGGVLALTDIDLREMNGDPLFSLPMLVLDLDWADLLRQDINLAALEIYEPHLHIDRDHSGRWNFERIAQPGNPQEKPSEGSQKSTNEPAQLPLVFIETFQLSGGQISFHDDAVSGGFKEHIHGIDLTLTGVSTHKSQKTDASLKLQTDSGFTLNTEGQIGISPVTVDLTVAADQLRTEPIYPYAEPYLNTPIQATLSAGAKVSLLESGNLIVNQGQLSLVDLQIPFYEEDRFNLKSLSVDNIALNLQEQNVSLGAIRFSQGDIAVSRLTDGSLSPLKLLKEQPQGPEPSTEPEMTDAKPWQLALDLFDLRQFKIAFTDNSLTRAPRATISELNIKAQNLSYPTAGKSPFDLGFSIGKKGKIKIAGDVVHTPLTLNAKTLITDFPLSDFNDFIPEQVNLSVEDGTFFSEMNLSLEQQEETFVGTFSGRTDVSQFNLRDPLGKGQLLKWDSLNIDGISGTLDPFKLHIKEVALGNYLANIQISADGRVNLASITSEGEQVADDIKEETVSKPLPQDKSSAPRPDIRIDALTLQGGTVSFVDRSMDSLFSTTMYELGGRVTGMASDAQMLADVDLRGQLENHSPLTISGQLNPLSEDLFADLTISFKDIDLAPMTPYSGTYLGYIIDKGKLYLDLSYHIEKRTVAASNKVLIDQFTLGDTVKSDKAMSLPLPLAIALLKDSNDEIHLNIPVRGSFDDPDFSIAGVIFTVIKNFFVKAATSPFSLLSSVIGQGGQDFSGISFDYGLSSLPDDQQGTLTKLAEALSKRPSLILEISPFADQEKDPEGYRRNQLRQMITIEKQNQLKDDGQSPVGDNITYSDEEYPELLLAVYKKADFPRPQNFVGMLKELPLEEMEKLLLANILVGDEELAELAKNRALAVRDALVTVNEDIKSRLFLKKTDIFQPAEDSVNSRVEFNISAK